MTTDQRSELTEKWEMIDEFPNYAISNQGYVVSLISLREIKSTPHYKNGYFSVLLTRDKTKKRISVHRLVARYFVDKNDCSFNEVNHKDGDKANNHYTNLEWCSRSINNLHAYATGLRSGVNNGNYKKNYYNSKSVLSIQDSAILEFNSVKECARYLGVNKSAVQRAIKVGSNCRGHKIYSNVTGLAV